MDNLTRQIANFAYDLRFDQLPQEVVGSATRFIVDSLACAIAAHDCAPAQIGLRLARGAVPLKFPGRIICHGLTSTAESAVFVNTTMIRKLHFNDEYPGGHPSDCLGAFLAIDEAARPARPPEQTHGRRRRQQLVFTNRRTDLRQRQNQRSVRTLVESQ